MGASRPFWGCVRAVKVTVFYKIGAFSAFRTAIFGFFEVGFRGRKDGHFRARDGHYDSNDHREHEKGRFRVVRKLSFSAPLPPRRAYRQTTEGRKALARCRSTENVYLCNIGKILTTPAGRLMARRNFLPFVVSHCGDRSFFRLRGWWLSIWSRRVVVSMCMYISVVPMLSWPSMAWMARRSAPPWSRAVAKL